MIDVNPPSLIGEVIPGQPYRCQFHHAVLLEMLQDVITAPDMEYFAKSASFGGISSCDITQIALSPQIP
jgi:hypothetical protein